MRNPQAAGEAKLKTLYAKDVDGIRKFKRKSGDPLKHARRVKGCKSQADLRGEPPGGIGGIGGAAACNGDHPDPDAAIDMRIGAFPSAERLHLRPAAQMNPFHYRGSPIAPRSPGEAFTSLPGAPYVNAGGQATASPRRRPADTPAVVTEIKAIQQTRRLLANARERSRVHTISAAFEALRKQVSADVL